MKCQRCNEREATIHIVQRYGDGKEEKVILCMHCANELGITVPTFSAPPEQTSFSLLNNLLGQYFGYTAAPVKSKPTKTCPQCGMTVEVFRANGKFGCAACYETFSEILDPVFARIQIGDRHKGRSCGIAGFVVETGETEKPLDTDALSGKLKKTEKQESVEKKRELTAKPKEKKPIKKDLAAKAGNSAETVKKQKAKRIAEHELLLKKAIDEEDYMQAAKIRDGLRALREGKGGAEK